MYPGCQLMHASPLKYAHKDLRDPPGVAIPGTASEMPGSASALGLSEATLFMKINGT